MSAALTATAAVTDVEKQAHGEILVGSLKTKQKAHDQTRSNALTRKFEALQIHKTQQATGKQSVTHIQNVQNVPLAQSHLVERRSLLLQSMS